jgi:hypothetical protein
MMRDASVAEPRITPCSAQGGIALPARRPALIALVCALPLLLLVSLAQATSAAPSSGFITYPYISEDSPYLHAVGSILYYSDMMGTGEEDFWLGGQAEGSDLTKVVCGTAFGEGPHEDLTPSVWLCGPYDVTGSDYTEPVIPATLYDSGGPVDTRYFPVYEDTALPTSTGSPPLYNRDGVIRVGFESADTESGVGLTRLWYKQGDSGVWELTLASSMSETGKLTYVTSEYDDDGYYYFKTVATDNVGNQMADPLPGSPGDGFTIYDTHAPTSTAMSPPLGNVETIPVTYTVGADLSGLEVISLHYSFEGSAWAPTAYASTAVSGVLDFEALDGDGVYEFRTIATDNAGNVGDGPSEYGYASARLDTVPPTATVASPPQVGSLSWQVSWYGDDPAPASGVAVYDVQVREDEGSWEDWLTGTSLADGTFGPSVPITVQNHLTYTFRVRAYDFVGNQGEWSPPVYTLVEVFYTYLPAVLSNTVSWDEFFEENDQCTAAYGPLKSGTPYRAYPDDTEDYYYFELSSPGRVIVDVTNYAPTSSSGTVALYGPDSCTNRIDYYGETGDTHMVLDNTLSDPGKYYVRVYTAEGYSTSQLYTLTVSY